MWQEYHSVHQNRASIMTKRQLGLLFIVGGVAGVIIVFAVDLLGAGQSSGIGPMQRLALGAAALTILVGLTLLPLGSRPA
jgi:hypothetical protein